MENQENFDDFHLSKLFSENVDNLRHTFNSQRQLLLVEGILNEHTIKKTLKQVHKLRYKPTLASFCRV
jgi:hypothetical protein